MPPTVACQSNMAATRSKELAASTARRCSARDCQILSAPCRAQGGILTHTHAEEGDARDLRLRGNSCA
eukprot:6303473-Lingulodinium_polyedra.AAC.1